MLLPQIYSLALSIALVIIVCVMMLYKPVKTTVELYTAIIMLLGLTMYGFHCYSTDYSRNNQHYSTVCSFALLAPGIFLFIDKSRMNIILLSYLCFNEFIGLFTEAGLVAFLVIMFILFRPFFNADDHEDLLTKTVKSLLLSILISGITTYTWHCTYFLGALSVCLSYLYRQRINACILHAGLRFNHAVGIAGIVAICFLGIEMRDQYYTRKWRATKLIVDTGQRIASMRSIYPSI